MTTWTFEDGSELLSGGIVQGDGVAAAKLRQFLDQPVRYRMVAVAPIPMDRVPLDVGSDCLLDALVTEIGFCVRQRVRTDYVERLEDVPENVRELWAAAVRSSLNNPPGTVY